MNADNASDMVCRLAHAHESRKVRAWIKLMHYTKTAPPGYIAALEFRLGRERIGAILLGRPTSRELDETVWIEVTRMHFVDATPLYVESRALAAARKWVRIWLPGIRAAIAYSDPSVGHEGTVYKADGWAAFGRTDSRTKPWRNRPGRSETHSPASKIRWVRSV